MNNDYGNDIVTISDDDGNEYEMEIIDIAEIDGGLYAAMIPIEKNDDGSFVVLRIIEDEKTGDQYFENIEDEETLDLVAEEFIRRYDQIEESEGQ